MTLEIDDLRLSQRCKLLVLIVPLFLVIACEPQDPGATGQLGLSAGVESEPKPGEYIEESFGNYSMRCMQGDDSAASIGSYVITILENGRAISEVTGVRDGAIQDCWMTNIDADESAEVLLFTRSAGSGGYAQLYVYEFAGDKLSSAEIPDPDADLMDGYQGRDSYEVTDGKLLRKFPIYLEDDSNCCPGGGNRVIEFDSANAIWILSENPAP